MSDTEICEQAIRDAVAYEASTTRPTWEGRLRAAYPSLRRQVLEAEVEKVARVLDAAADGMDLDDVDRVTAVPSATAANAARRVLGISEGDGD